jgi:hypothetical protein
MLRTAERELLQASEKTGITKHKWTQNLCLLPTCRSLYLIHFQPSESARLLGECNTLFWREPHILAQLGSGSHPLKKTGRQTHGGNISLVLVGGKNSELKKSVWVEWLSSFYRESQALYCFAETKSKLKLTISPKEKLISNLQACPVSGRDGDCSFAKPSQDHFWEHPAPEASPHKEALVQTPRAETPPKLSNK